MCCISAMMTMKYRDFWQGDDGIRNVIPRSGRSGEFPELPGFHPVTMLQEIIQVFPVVEIGCGYGRLAEAFDAEDYVGLDPNAEAIDRAKRRLPEYRFHVIDGYKYPPSMSKFAYTVAMHIPDDEYPIFVKAMCDTTGDQIVIAEILGREKRRKLEKKPEGYIHATFGRHDSDHEHEFDRNGWSLVTYFERPYPGKGTFSFLDFRRNPKDAA